MMAAARYTWHLPAQDELGNPLRVHTAVQRHVGDIGFQTPVTYAGDPYHTVEAWGEDHPENDSTAKQIGAYAGEIANVPSIHVTKTGDKTASWPIPNPLYRPAEGAENCAVATEPNIDTILMQQPMQEDNMMDPYGRSHPLNSAPNPLTHLTSIHSQLVKRARAGTR